MWTDWRTNRRADGRDESKRRSLQILRRRLKARLLTISPLSSNVGNFRGCVCKPQLIQKYTVNSLWIKSTDALCSNFIGIMTLHVSDSLSAHHQEFLVVHRHWYNLCSLVTECFQGLPNCINWTNADVAKNSWLWAERLPETCKVVIPIKLELSASVGFIHKESIRMHGHTVLKKDVNCSVVQVGSLVSQSNETT